MRHYLLAALCCSSLAAYGQPSKKVSVPLLQRREAWADTSSYVRSRRYLVHKLRLENLRHSTAAFYFRFWTSDQVLDIWTPDSVTYYGCITSFAQRYNPQLLRKQIWEIDTVIYQRSALSNHETTRILRLLNRLSILTIPSDNQIAGWGDGFDGVGYVTETSTKSQYALKTYWSPNIFQNKLPEAKRLQALVDSLSGEFKLAEYRRKLQLPPGHYLHNGIEGVKVEKIWPNGYPEPEHKVSIYDWF